LQVELDDVEHISETTLTIRGTRRRTTVPKVIVDRLNLRNSDMIRWMLFRDGRIIVTKVKQESE
jgi:bifunctional DNA-binding transcriptional regulator/antitoxin component of YhaV-PrlF toxin-antitoxin module